MNDLEQLYEDCNNFNPEDEDSQARPVLGAKAILDSIDDATLRKWLSWATLQKVDVSLQLRV